jgi:dTDP-4-dehydrorhamnose reductase
MWIEPRRVPGAGNELVEAVMHVLVVGAGGQVGQSLAELGALDDMTWTALRRDRLDLTRPETISAALAALKPDLVINAAAYTDVNRAEAEPEQALAVNAAGAGVLAALTAHAGIPILHLSTDYVFDGRAAEPYRETDATAPLNVYGQTKRAGELEVAAANPRHLILRSAWIYSPFRRNFVSTMLDLAARQDRVRVVGDQIGSPTSAFDIAEALRAVSRQILADPDTSVWGTYHLAARGQASWAELAVAVFEASAAAAGPHAHVETITTQDYPTPALRPANSRLDTNKFEKTFAIALPFWKDSVGTVVRRILSTRSG